MKLRNTRERLISNVRVWRANLENGLKGAPMPDVQKHQVRHMVADLALIEIALKRPFQNDFEIDYEMPGSPSVLVKPPHGWQGVQ